MKTTIKQLTNERIDQEIANIYWSASKEQPGLRLKEKGLLALLWEEFDERASSGKLDVEDWGHRGSWV